MTVAVRDCDIRDVIDRAPPIFLIQGEWHKILVDFVISDCGMESLCTLWLARELELGERSRAETHDVLFIASGRDKKLGSLGKSGRDRNETLGMDRNESPGWLLTGLKRFGHLKTEMDLRFPA